MSSNGGSDRVTNKDLYDSQADQDAAMQKKLDRLERLIDARPTTRTVMLLIGLSVAANQAAARMEGVAPSVRSALAFLGF